MTNRRRYDPRGLRTRRQARHHYLDLYHHAPTAYLTLDAAGVILDANCAAEALLGAPRAQLVGCRLRNFAERTSVAALERHLAEVFAARLRRAREIELHAFDGAARSIRLESVVVTGGARPRRCVAALIDVTEDRRREAELRRLAAVVSNSPDAIVVLDLRGRILAWNRGAEALYGYPAAEVLGRDLLAFVPAAHRPALVAIAERILDGEAVATFESQRLTRDGRVLDVSVTAALLRGPGGRREAYTTTERDITASKQGQAELREREKLEALGQLAVGVAHDYANVFMGLDTCLELARRHVDPDAPAVRYLDRCVAAVRRGAGLCTQLKSFGRPQPGASCRVAVDPLVADAVELLRHVLGEPYEVTFAAGGAGAEVLADPGRLEQVIVNLALNARDAMPTGGRVEVTSAVRAGAADGRDAVELTVRDHGAGIAAAALGRIFEPFFTTRSRGTGLGLVMVRRTVDELDGRIVVDSAVGRGTTVRIALPVAPPAAGAAAGGGALVARAR